MIGVVDRKWQRREELGARNDAPGQHLLVCSLESINATDHGWREHRARHPRGRRPGACPPAGTRSGPRAGRFQDGHDLGLSPRPGMGQRRDPIAIGQVHVGAVVDQQCDDRLVPRAAV